jgi:hypothetical protein
MRPTACWIAAVALALVVGACGGSGDDGDQGGNGGDGGNGGGDRGAGPPLGSEDVALDPGDFSVDIDNPYWPMRPGARWVYREREDGATQRVVVTVTDDTKKVAAGIAGRVLHDIVTEGGEKVEDTYDWYAQDRDGNIWYLGEDTTEFEDGKAAGKEGSWEAGVDGAKAGIIMPADPEVGMRYRQEYYEGHAEDEGRVLSLDEQAEVPFGHWEDVLMTRDTTPLEPDLVEHKFYARGVGPVLTVAVSGSSGREELIRFDDARP